MLTLRTLFMVTKNDNNEVHTCGRDSSEKPGPRFEGGLVAYSPAAAQINDKQPLTK